MLWVYGGLNESGPYRPFDYLLGPHLVELLGEDWEVWFCWRRCTLKYEISHFRLVLSTLSLWVEIRAIYRPCSDTCSAITEASPLEL